MVMWGVLLLCLSVSSETVVGTWYLNKNGSSIQVDRTRDVVTIRKYAGELVGLYSGPNGNTTLSAVSFDDQTGRFEFQRVDVSRSPQVVEWYRLTVVDGIFTGRYSSGGSIPKPKITAFQFVVSGWCPEVIDDGAIVPRSWDIVVNTTQHARLRIDVDLNGHFLGRFKVYHTGGPDQPPRGSDQNVGEQLEFDVNVTRWDGTDLSFIRISSDGTFQETFYGHVTGRLMNGTHYTSRDSTLVLPWSGERWAVLDHGFARPVNSTWQKRARRRLTALMMAGDPKPAGAPSVVKTPVSLSGTAYGSDRDDNPAAHPQAYTLTELNFTHTLANPYDGAAVQRLSHGYLAVPTTPPPASGRYPAVLTLNGHGGSAWQMMYPPQGDIYWYGDACARRGYVVLALDMSHRNQSIFYDDHYSNGGDDPAHGNGNHPAIKFPEFANAYSDWEEDGERAWDAMRALDYLESLDIVDTSRLVVTGLSMGGEVSTVMAALDTRPALVIATGYSPDMDVVYHHGNHPCWLWSNSNWREMIDTETMHALRAPHPFIVETGRQDTTYSAYPTPFSADKQLARRTRASYGELAPQFMHYLHWDVHRWHAGDVEPGAPPEAQMYVRLPTEIAPPLGQPLSQAWQTSSDTEPPRVATLFDWMADILNITSVD